MTTNSNRMGTKIKPLYLLVTTIAECFSFLYLQGARFNSFISVFVDAVQFPLVLECEMWKNKQEHHGNYIHHIDVFYLVMLMYWFYFLKPAQLECIFGKRYQNRDEDSHFRRMQIPQFLLIFSHFLNLDAQIWAMFALFSNVVATF